MIESILLAIGGLATLAVLAAGHGAAAGSGLVLASVSRLAYHNLNTYWASFTTSLQLMLWLLDDYGIQWAVLGVLRQFYTFRERAITSKASAGMYGLLHTPAHWRPLIHDAIP